MKRKAWFGLLLASMLLALAPLAAESAYYGSTRSNKYHVKSCRWAKKIHAVNWVVFKDAKEAKQAGYVPCKVCKPELEPVEPKNQKKIIPVESSEGA